MHEWVNLTTRMGESITNPTPAQMRQVLEELFSSNDEEHPDCWIECGTQDGPLHSLAFFSSGRGVYTKYSDVDMSAEIENKVQVAPNIDIALRLWGDLINERYEKLS
jgi:hypothetical protein